MRSDLIRVIEAGYRMDGDDAAWLRAVAMQAREAVPGGPGAVAWTFRHDAGQREECVAVDLSLAHLDALQLLLRELGALGTRDPSTTGELRSVVTLLLGVRPPPAWRALESLGVRDVLVAWRTDSAGAGLGLAWCQGRRLRISDAQAMRWDSVMRQLAQARAMRLRVLGSDRSGREAEPPVATDALREERRATARAADAALTGEDHREDATIAWSELQDGRWSAADRFDAGGRRWLVARRSREAAPRLGTVDGRILQLRASGVSMKVIAAELGLSVSAVSRRLERGMSAIAVRTPSELAALLATTSISEGDAD